MQKSSLFPPPTCRQVNARAACARGTCAVISARTSSRRVNAKRATVCLRPRDEPSSSIGELVPGKGVYLGVWSPKDRAGISLNKAFNVYAAPYDLGLDENGRGKKLLLTYNRAVKRVAQIGNLMGHNGAKYNNDTELYEALRNATYNGEWFIPPRDLVNGNDLVCHKVQNDNLYQHRNTGKFANTFTTTDSASDFGLWYWSCTEGRTVRSFVYAVQVTDGVDFWDSKDSCSLSVRPVRLELRP